MFFCCFIMKLILCESRIIRASPQELQIIHYYNDLIIFFDILTLNFQIYKVNNICIYYMKSCVDMFDNFFNPYQGVCLC